MIKNFLKKKDKKTKNKPKRSNQFYALLVLSAATGALLLVAAVGAYVIQDMKWQIQAEGNGKITTLILQAVDGLSNPAPVDAETGKVYLPQASLVLPAMDDTVGVQIEYKYSPARDGFPEEIGIVNTYGFWSARSQMIGAESMEDTFKAVPALQACSRGYQLSFAPIDKNPNPLKFSKVLSDSRALYVYLDVGCKQANDAFEAYLKQIDSY